MGIGKFEMVDMLVGFQPISPLLLFAGKQMVANGFNTLFRERENILHNFLKTYNEMRYNSEEPSNDFLSFFSILNTYPSVMRAEFKLCDKEA